MRILSNSDFVFGNVFSLTKYKIYLEQMQLQTLVFIQMNIYFVKGYLALVKAPQIPAGRAPAEN